MFQIFQFFVRLDHIRKCFTQKGGIFILEEFSMYFFLSQYFSKYNRIQLMCVFFFLFCICLDPKTRQIIQRKYMSSMVSTVVTFCMPKIQFVFIQFVHLPSHLNVILLLSCLNVVNMYLNASSFRHQKL